MSGGLWDFFRMGGPVMWLLLVASVVAVGVFLERVFFFHRASVHIDYFMRGLTQLLKEHRYEEALERCDETYGPAVRVIQAAILKRQLPKADLRDVVEEVAQLQVPRLEANLGILSTVATIAPLLGLFGTVSGMIKAFYQVDRSLGNAPVSLLAEGIWEALITTAAGLAVAIPCYVAYNFLVARFNRIVSDMERVGIEVVQILTGTSVDTVPRIIRRSEVQRGGQSKTRDVSAEGGVVQGPSSSTPKTEGKEKSFQQDSTAISRPGFVAGKK